MWRSIGARARGSANSSQGAPCQDAFGYVALSPTITAVAVADGEAPVSPAAPATSGGIGALGAEVAVDRALRYLQNVADLLDLSERWPPAVRGAFEAARGAVLDAARAAGVDPTALVATLQIVLLGPNRYCYGRVGSGGAVGIVRGALVPLVPAPHDPFVHPATSLVAPDSRPEVFFQADELSDCALFTDGLAHQAMQFSQWRPQGPFFCPLFEFLRDHDDVTDAEQLLDNYLNTDRFDARTDDDRTLVIATWMEDI